MKVTDIMTKEVVSVQPDDSLITAAQLITEKGYDGLPVVSATGTLVGLVTQANLVGGKTNIHLPTLLVFLNKFDLYRKDKKFVQKQLDGILSLKVKDVMNPEPPLLYENESVDRAIMHLSNMHGVNPTAVVSEERKLLGVVTRRDLFKIYEGKYPGIGEQTVVSPLVEERIGQFLDSFEKNFLFISRWRTKAWIGINIFFLIAGVFIAAFFMLRVQIR